MTHNDRHERIAAAPRGDRTADSALRDRLADLPTPAPANAAFLRRLLSIPQTTPDVGRAGMFDRLAAALAETGERLAAPRLLAGEAAALAGALALGLWLGVMTGTGAADSVDLSAYLMADLEGPFDVGGETE